MQSRYQYIVFSPYFGKLPAMFDLWAESCGHNPQFLFLVFTDDNYTGALPENVQIKKMSFAELKTLVQSKFDFPVSLPSPYKLCDYKPAMGYIFEEYLQGCAYWGHCDMDLIFGDLSKFLPTEKTDKISHVGHLCLYRNVPEITKAFMQSSRHPITYKEVFSLPTHFAFDENDDFGINAIFRMNKLSIYPFEQTIADVGAPHPNFHLSRYQNPGFSVELGARVFEIDNGHVYGHTLTASGIEKKEYAYVHLQKRSMERKCNSVSAQYLITPMGFEPWQTVSAELIRSRQKKVSAWTRLLHKLSVKRVSSPRALRRKWAVAKITCRHILKGTKKI